MDCEQLEIQTIELCFQNIDVLLYFPNSKFVTLTNFKEKKNPNLHYGINALKIFMVD
jgi:hypothetical protein